MSSNDKSILKKLYLVLVLLEALATNASDDIHLYCRLKEKQDVGSASSYSIENPSTKQDFESKARLPTWKGRSLKQQDESSCSLTQAEIDEIYNPSTGVWTLNETLLEEDVDIIQDAINCSSENDVILLSTNATLQPSKTIVITRNLTLSANPGGSLREDGVLIEAASKVNFTCSRRAGLFLFRGGSVRLANIIFTRCISSGDIVSLDAECEDEDSRNEVELHHVEFEDNVLSGDARIIATTNPSCTKLTLHDVALFENTCSGAGCISLAAVNSFTNVRILDNSIAANPVVSHAVFDAPVLSTITATHISATSNQIRIFSLFDSTLSVSNSHFLRNEIVPSSSVSHRSIGGGVLLSNQSRITMTNCQLEDNSGQNGGALYALESQINLRVCTFQRNDALGGIGGAIRAWDSSVVLARTLFFRNTARFGGACYFLRTSVTLRNVVFRSNAVTDGIGGGLYNGDGEITGQTVRFVSNAATTLGGGLYCHYTPHVSLSDVHFRNNSGTSGAAISMITTTIELKSPCTFVNNRGTSNGGGLYQTNSSSSMTSCYFHFNSARNGGALSVDWRSHAIVQDCRFFNGTATFDGGAIELNQNSSINISNSLFSGNHAQRGGALLLTDLSNSTISSCIFGANNIAATGGAISAYNRSMVLLSNTTIHDNEAEQGGGINIEDSTFMASECNLTQNIADFQGGAIRGSRSAMEISHSGVSRSSSRDGAGVHLFRMNTIDVDSVFFQENLAEEGGGAMRVEFNRALALISNCTFSRNQAGDGASMYLLGAPTQIMDSWFESNSAFRRGAGLYLDESNVTLRRTEVSSNNASSYAGVCALDESQLVGEGLLVLSNTASEDGGGIGVDEGSSFRCRDCEFMDNIARRGAGMFANSDDSKPIVVQLQDSRFEGNNASNFGGAIHFSRPFDVSVNCTNTNATCSRLVSLNTSFVANHARRSGSVVMTADPEGMLFSCNESPQGIAFLGRDQLSSLHVIHPNNICASWERNQLPEEAVGGVIGTYGVRMSFSISDDDEAQMTKDAESDYLVLNIKRRAQLPVIRVRVQDAYGNSPLPTVATLFEAEMSFSKEFLPRNISTTIAGGIGEFSSISSVKPPDDYTLHIRPREASVESANLIVRIHECEVGEELTPGGELCRKCGNTSYNFYPINGSCTACPPGATCESSYIIPQQGYWHHSLCHAEVMRCLNDEACQYEDRQQKIASFVETFPDCKTNNTFNASYDQVLCRPGYEGPLCGSCQHGYGLSLEFRCSECPHDAWSILTIIFFMLYLLVVASFTIRGSLPTSLSTAVQSSRPSSQPDIVWNSTRSVAINLQMVEMMRDGYVPPEVINPSRQISESDEDTQDIRDLELARWMTTEILKILINFLQVTAIAATINVEWTEEILRMFEGAEYVGALTTAALSRPIDCILGTSSSTVRSIWRTMVGMLVPGTVMGVFVLFWGRKSVSRGEGVLFFWKRSLLSILAVAYISYVGLTKLAVRVFYCVDIYDSEDFDSTSMTSRWAIDTSIECYGKDHYGLIAIGVIILALVSLSFPLVSAFVILRNRSQNDPREGWMFETMGFLNRAFKERFMFWESVVMLRKACLSIIVVFSYPLGSHVQGLLAQIVLLFSICAHLKCLPYREELHCLNSYEFGSLLVSSLTFLLGQFFGDEKSGQFTRDFVAFLIIGMNVLFFLFLVIVLTLGGLDQMRVVLKSEGFPVDDNTAAWKLIKVYVVSRISRCSRSAA